MSEDKQKKVPPISYESAAEEIWHNSPDTFLTIEEMDKVIRKHKSAKWPLGKEVTWVLLMFNLVAWGWLLNR